MKNLGFFTKILRWKSMEVELHFLVLRLFVILCTFAIHGFTGARGHVSIDAVSPAVAHGFSSERHGYRVAEPPKSSLNWSPHKSHSFFKAPTIHGSIRHTHSSFPPSESPSHHIPREHINSLESSHENSYFKHHHHHHHPHPHYHAKKQYGKEAAGPSHPPSPLSYAHQHTPPAFEISPSLSPSPSPSPSPYSSVTSQNSPMPAPSSRTWKIHVHPPSVPPLSSSLRMSPPPTTFVLPSPPPNQDCTAITCVEPMTYTPSGIPCGCVWPMQIRLQFNVALYKFFPLVSKLATQIASSLTLDQGQVRITGANAASQQLEKTVVLINLVPLQGEFKHAAAISLYEKFWHKQIYVNPSLFGSYEVLDVHYPGLPPSPPSLSSNLAAIDDHPYPANYKGNNGSSLKPLGVEIPRRQKSGSNRNLLAVIIISVVTAFLTCAGIAWILIARRRYFASRPDKTSSTAMSSFTKPPGAARSLAAGSKSFSRSFGSFGSGMLNFTGSAKNFSLDEIERATDGFDSSRVLGEGGFGVVYMGYFDDGEQVAVKVLKKNKRHGIHEFLSEVEMLSRLHHKNLVKLLGICTEDHARCLVYELVPNGSVESHLHGLDKAVAPLDWATRMKIALGAARGLAYLHEDSNPCVIHRDFKSSNILLEHDFTPKVSDFGLARNALKEGNQPISTHVIGTFGYLAPEYAMTGHLLVKSDVYSYGVVLLELLTGRKPVDFSKPPGQENLVAWALPLLTSKEGLEIVMDPVLKPCDDPFDSFSKVAAIASMCVQPEVSRRPFMGEVVQALKLVCSELDDANEEGPAIVHFNQAKVLVGDNKNDKISAEFQVFLGTHYPALGYESCCDAKVASSAVDLTSVTAEFGEEDHNFTERHCSSGPLGSARKKSFWHKFGRFSRGSMKEHLWPGSH